MSTTHMVFTGAVYIDTILSVPHFPSEDTKLRAKAITKRRGGNTANTLEVLSQLLSHSAPGTCEMALHLVAVLPERDSPATTFIAHSLPGVDIQGASLFRTGYRDAASSYIIQSEETQSRTIVSVNELPELVVGEYEEKIKGLRRGHGEGKWWFHFEGRIPSVTLACVEFLLHEYEEQQQQQQAGDYYSSSIMLSIECENPSRSGMEKVAQLADIVFYSKLWARENGFEHPRPFLAAQRNVTKSGALLCCTWGAGGATALQKRRAVNEEDVWAQAEAWHPPRDDDDTGQDVVVDTVGAGDTFIAGMLFSVMQHGQDWELVRKLAFANEVAGRKVYQQGLRGLGEQVMGG
jgi:ketohexokinase